MPFQIKKFQTSLQRWYERTKRDLPWRKTKDPYKILVSEMMLQQTQVSTVIPYYKRWIKQFPNFKSLAQAPESSVLKAWQGLGYYRRAKLLHKNAQAVCKEHKSCLPSDYDKLIQLPGIGRYTAGAVASIAFEIKAPVLDGNVIRIMTRILSIKKNTKHAQTLTGLWEIAEDILPEKNIGDFNQALMELGATVCTPKKPLCEKCPVAFTCEAFKSGNPETFPVKTPSLKITKQTQYAFAIFNKQKQLLIQKQTPDARWAGLWTLPHFDDYAEALSHFKFKKTDASKIQTNKHGFTRYQITLHSFKAFISKSKIPNRSNYLWIKKDKINQYPFPTVHQKIVDQVLG